METSTQNTAPPGRAWTRGLSSTLLGAPNPNGGSEESNSTAAAAPPGGSLTRGLSSALLGTPFVGEEAGASAQSNYGPLRRSSTTEVNRSRVQENQRILAAQMLSYSLPMMGFLLLVLLALLIGVLVIYIRGWSVMINDSSKPCDQPLRWWLLATLLSPWLKGMLVVLRKSCSNEPDPKPYKLQGLLSPALIIAGWWMYSTCETCQKTNPELYQYAKLFLIFEAVCSCTSLLVTCCLMSFVFWMHRNGLLEAGPGPLSAARPGLVQELETVAFSPVLFSQSNEEDLEPPECSICQDEFSADKVIKKTPCGHYFHEECLGEWLENYGKCCPLCRKDLEEAMDPSAAEP